MKKTILALMAVTLVAGSLQTARAGDHEWAIAGKVLTGVVAASVVSQAFAPPPPVYTYAPAPVYAYAPPPAPVYVAPAPVVYAPAPVVYAPAPPVVVYRPPVVCAPAPVVHFGFSFGGGHHHHRGRW